MTKTISEIEATAKATVAVAVCFEEAADLIDKVGWTKNVFVQRNNEGKPIGYCMVGAIREICSDLTNNGEMLAQILQFRSYAAMVWFNDRKTYKDGPRAGRIVVPQYLRKQAQQLMKQAMQLEHRTKQETAS